MNKHRSSRTEHKDFADEVLVVCPACERCALVRIHQLIPPAKQGNVIADHEAKLVCLHCSHNEREFVFSMTLNGPCDPAFRLPVWLRIDCCGEKLWAYNAKHLNEIEAFVQAPLRERRTDDAGWSNRAWTSRMPAWFKSAKNRDEILRCIARLRRERLPQSMTTT